jgi:hypothetical protein
MSTYALNPVNIAQMRYENGWGVVLPRNTSRMYGITPMKKKTVLMSANTSSFSIVYLMKNGSLGICHVGNAGK